MDHHAAQAAERLLSAPNLKTEEQRLRHLYLTFYDRVPDKKERLQARQFLDAYLKSGEEVTTLDAWTALCQTCFASNEFVYLN